MAEIQWYYARNDEPFGPVSATELKQLADSGQIAPDDLLWREGMEAWTTAVNLRGLFSPEASADKLGDASLPGGAARRPPRPGRSRAQLHALVRAAQTALWCMCVFVVLLGVVLFTRAFMNAKDAQAEAAAGALYSTFFIAAYVLARCGEKLSQVLLSHGRRRDR